MEERRPLYSFEAPEPVERPRKSKAWLVPFTGIAGVGLVIALFGGYNQRPQQVQYRGEPSPDLVGTRTVPCPAGYRSVKGTFARCIALDVPATGAWVRRVGLSNSNWEIPSLSGVQARGCNGDIYTLSRGGNRIDESCGYLDYRSTDHTSQTIIEGHDPR